MIGMIIVEMPQMGSREEYMALSTYIEEATMVVLDHELVRQIIEVINKGYDFGDLSYEMFLHFTWDHTSWWSNKREASLQRWQTFMRRLQQGWGNTTSDYHACRCRYT
jgi:hypothetical protein